MRTLRGARQLPDDHPTTCEAALRRSCACRQRYFLVTATQFTTTLIGLDSACSGTCTTRKRWPFAAGTKWGRKSACATSEASADGACVSSLARIRALRSSLRSLPMRFRR